MLKEHLSITAESNTLDYLGKAYFFIRKIEKGDEYVWKWATIALHGSLYGFAICACRGSSNLQVTYRTKNGKEQLIRFDDVIKQCQNESLMRQYCGVSEVLVLTETQKKSINFMTKELRNNFEHYIPMCWGIVLDGLPEVFIDVLDVIYFLGLKTGNCIHLEQADKEKIELYIQESKQILTNFSTQMAVADNKRLQNAGG
ncbi:MAG: hypothetical protein COU30_00810 [Candidatus Magasanikbacteria bacterium CG10_big_fil_rev_8_21_14_0_10_38_6]|uniref:Uncharacterized protein n=1 Tax=Candidatus Magasanikbacteria bacterium CG10_big_fil_rev_8_21_14_0_10_38_6 TaxID=1974647 RepID=A0A2M6P2F4_9BACT|nr:MAG: hypothetical protein COU30_00810 [Candidatus Magasanikbacteria bacterium CG10_big_fil_rev_8_21_14_0_10_38_6]